MLSFFLPHTSCIVRSFGEGGVQVSIGASGTCFSSCFDKSCKQGARIASSNQVFPRLNLIDCSPGDSDY